MPKDSIILAEQIRTIDRSRLRKYVGSLNKELMKEIDGILKISIGVGFDD